VATEMQLKLKSGNSGPLSWLPSKLWSADPENSADMSLLLLPSKTGSTSLFLQQEAGETVGRSRNNIGKTRKSIPKITLDSFAVKYLIKKNRVWGDEL